MSSEAPRQVRRKLRRLLKATEPRKAPAMRLAGSPYGSDLDEPQLRA